jgi:hypothetical protein
VSIANYLKNNIKNKLESLYDIKLNNKELEKLNSLNDNLNWIKDYLIETLENRNKYSNNINNNINNNNNKTEKLEIFHILGKICYNKRKDPEGKVIRPTKNQILDKKKYKKYFDIEELILDMPCSFNNFNDMLHENAINFFKDIKEYNKVAETFSFTEKLNQFKYINNDNDDQLKILRSVINSYAITEENLSQYEENNVKTQAAIDK